MSDRPITLTVDGYDASVIEDRVCIDLAEAARAELRTRLDKEIAKHVDAIVTAEFTTQIRERVATILDAGWEQMSEYGERTGRQITIKSRVSELMNPKPGSYGSFSFKDEVHRIAGKAIEKELAEASKTLKAMVDDEVKGRLTDALKSALGLR